MAGTDDPALRAALDFLLIARMSAKVCAGLTAAVFTVLCIRANGELETDSKVVKEVQPGTSLNMQFSSFIEKGPTIAGPLALHAPLMILFIGKRWHHPPTKQRKGIAGFLHRSRVSMMTMMSGQFCIPILMATGVVSYFEFTKRIEFVPAPADPDALAAKAGIKLSYLERPLFIEFLVCAYAMSLAHVIGFVLEFLSYRKFKRVAASAAEAKGDIAGIPSSDDKNLKY